MLKWKEVLSKELKNKIREQLLAPYPGVTKLRIDIEKREDKDDFENLDLFYWGNIQKRNLKKELRELAEHKPDFVVSFIQGIEARSKTGEDITSEYQSIYFTIKKEA